MSYLTNRYGYGKRDHSKSFAAKPNNAIWRSGDGMGKGLNIKINGILYSAPIESVLQVINGTRQITFAKEMGIPEVKA